MPKTVQTSSWDVTPGLVDAIQTWSEFLRGDRSAKEWGVAGAKMFLTSEGFKLPAEPISTVDLITLRSIAQEAGRMADGTTAIKRNTMSNMRAAAAQVNTWLEANCSVKLDADVPMSSRSDMTLTDAIQSAKAIYDDPTSELAGFTTGMADQTNNYDVVNSNLDLSLLAKNEYDIVDRLTDSNLDPVYWTPPPPEAELLQDAGISGI